LIRFVPAAVLAVALLSCPACGKKRESNPLVSRVTEGETSPAVREETVPPAHPDTLLEARIFPEIARRGIRLQLSATGFSLRQGEIEWMVNGDLVPGQHEGSFPTGRLRKGSSVQVRVKVGEREVHSNVVTLANSPPEIRSVRIVPEIIRPGDPIAVEVSGSDPDGDDVAFEYAWEKNGLPAGTGSKLEATLRRGDEISVRITPFDGEVRGNFLVVRREVLNFPPSVEGVFDTDLADGVYTAKVGATDGDNDPLTYSLAEAPPEMTIEPGTGAIRWKVPDGFHGKAPVTVSITDGHGGETSYPMVLTILEEEPPKK